MVILLIAGADGQAFAAKKPPLQPLSITRADGKVEHFRVAVADTDEKRMKGLMFRKKLAADEGMLFPFPQPKIAYMWMKNTYVPLDMLFIGTNGVIRHIAKATPLSTDVISSEEVVASVLELPGGTAERLHLAVGDKAVLPGPATPQ